MSKDRPSPLVKSPLFFPKDASVRFFDTYALSPSDLILSLHRSVAYRIANSTRKAPGPEIESTHNLDATGIVRVGAWRRTRKGKKAKYLVLHWPTILQHAHEFIDSDFPELTQLLWTFHPLLQTRSFTCAALLRRKLHYVFAHTRHVARVEICDFHDAEFRKLTPLSGNEEKVLDELLSHLSKDKALCEALTDSTETSFKGVSRPSKDLKYRTSRLLRLEPNTFTLLSWEDMRKKRDALPADISLRTPSGLMRFPLDGTENIKELSYALHYLSVSDGIERLVSPTQLADDEYGDCLVINAPLYSAYRSQVTDFYVKATASDLAGNWPILTHRFFDLLSMGHSDLSYPSGQRDFSLDVARLKPWNNIHPSHCMFLSCKRVEESLRDQAHSSLRRSVGRFKRKNFTPTPKVTRNKARWKIWKVSTVPLADLNGKQFPFHVTKHGRVVFFCPPWEVEVDRTSVLPPGVKYISALGCNGYSYRYLLKESHKEKTKSRLLAQSRSLRDWMEYLVQLPGDAFKPYCSSVGTRVRLSENKSLLSGAFTDVEDAAIMFFYNPGMTKEHKQTLREACNTRSWDTILRRVTFLRRKLISEGMFDPRFLPHKNYNVHIRREIECEKEKRGLL